jgi:hypothetical protein
VVKEQQSLGIRGQSPTASLFGYPLKESKACFVRRSPKPWSLDGQKAELKTKEGKRRNVKLKRAKGGT